MTSFFLERTRRKVRSFCGSMSRTVLRAFITSWWISPAYCTVLGLSRVVLMGIPDGEPHVNRLTQRNRLVSLPFVSTKMVSGSHFFSL